MKHEPVKEVSFKEIFHEDYEIDESVNKVERSEEYTDTQLKIQSINQDYNKFLESLKSVQGVQTIGHLLMLIGLLTMIGSVIGSPLGEGLAHPVLFGIGCALTLLPPLFLVFYTGYYEIKTPKKEKEYSQLLKSARAKLLRSYFNGTLLNSVDLNEDWQTVEVLENGLVKSYIVKCRINENGLEFIESKEIVNN